MKKKNVVYPLSDHFEIWIRGLVVVLFFLFSIQGVFLSFLRTSRQEKIYGYISDNISGVCIENCAKGLVGFLKK